MQRNGWLPIGKKRLRTYPIALTGDQALRLFQYLIIDLILGGAGSKGRRIGVGLGAT